LDEEMMSFQSWWIEFRGFDDPIGKEGAYLAFEAGVNWERNRCRYPECVENEEERCIRWLTGECEGPNK
jgi:hypothetical protein